MNEGKDRKELGNEPPKYGRGQNPNSRKNLEKGMAKPGDVLNPFGKPPGTKDRSTGLKKWLALNIPFNNLDEETEEKIFPELAEKLEITVEDAIDLALITEAKNGNINAIKEIKDSLYGKVGDTLDIGNKNGEPFEQKIQVEFIDDKPAD
jgi:hypothetical protein